MRKSNAVGAADARRPSTRVLGQFLVVSTAFCLAAFNVGAPPAALICGVVGRAGRAWSAS